MNNIICYWLTKLKCPHECGTVASGLKDRLMGDGIGSPNVRAGTVVHVSADFENATNGPKGIYDHARETWGHARTWLGRKRVHT